MMKVLIIEDDAIIAHIYRNRLEKEGFQVEVAPDGQTGFYRIHETRPDAILLDLMLPKMDGMQILKKIRAQKQFQEVPVLVFTNRYLPDMVQEATRSGATHSPLPSPTSASVTNPAEPLTSGAPSAFGVPTAVPVNKGNIPAVSRGGIPFPQMPAAAPAAKSGPDRVQPSPAVAVPTISGDRDDEFQEELWRSFFASIPEALNALRRNLHEFIKGGNDAARMARLMEFYRQVHALTGNAAIVDLQNVAQMGSAMEALVKELNDKPKRITPSTLRTLARGLDFLVVLIEKARGPSLIENPPINILVVDDDVISQRAVVLALDKVSFKSEAIEDPMVALRLLGEKTYDLVILDVDMPGMNGFDLCKKLRAVPANQTTPVVFVTGMTDLQSRALSSLSGGNDLITKPFLFVELTVKVLTMVMNHRLEQRNLAAGT